MANRSILVMKDGQVQAQPSSDNIVLAAPLNVGGSAILSGIGDIILVPTANDCVVGGSGHTTNNAVLGFIGGGANCTLQSSNHGFIGAGIDCRVLADDAVVLGGNNNDALSACSVVLGGQDNTANATYATVLGGKTNIASGNHSIAGGNSSNATGIASVAIGKSCVASGDQSIAMGNGVTVSSNYAVGIGTTLNISGNYAGGFGYNHTVSGDYAFAAGGTTHNISGNYSAIVGGGSNVIASENSAILGGGSNNIASGATFGCILAGQNNKVTASYGIASGNGAVCEQLGAWAHAGGYNTVVGDAQCIRATTYGSSTSNNSAILYLDGSTTNLKQPADSIWMSKVHVTGVRSDGANGASYFFIYTTRRDGTANVTTTANVQTNPYVLVLTEDDTNWNAAMNINGADNVYASVIGTSNASATYRWVATWEIMQVKAS